ncbi:putative glycosyl hydrolase [Burkholderiales bacterium JOSHI_001]|nr:putative glycosyl hydrolase [Burkholderiales bacterium JOSHI_001]
MACIKWVARFAFWLFLGPTLALHGVAAQPVKAGEGAYHLGPKSGDKGLPAAPLRTAAMLKQAAPTSQWYSTLIFNPKPFPIYVQPMTVRTTEQGFEMALPSKEVTATERRDTEVAYLHRDPLLLSPVGFEPGPAKLAGVGDWSIDISMARGADDMLITVAHGNPYAYIQLTRGDLRVRLPATGERFDGGADARTLALRIKGKAYALFAPTGARWEAVSATEWIARLPAGKHFVSAAVLPDDKAETLVLLQRHAYAFVQGTRVQWRYDVPASQVETTFSATTRIMEGPDAGPLYGLYPHHWFKNASVEGQLGPAYDTVRGKVRLLAAARFTTTHPYVGFVPHWPGVGDSARKAELADLMKTDLRNARRMMLPEGQGAYWQGKGLQRILKLMDVHEQQGDKDARDQLLAMLKKRMEEWLGGGDSKRYFFVDRTLGAVASYPDEFFGIAEVNDHHFWYGYWIRVAAEIALRDPAWAAKERWGAMVDLLVADIATTERGRADFPFLRNFDPYEGHSWANGLGGVGEYGLYGNNQESSSEAINAWVGLILWGEVTGNRDLRDLGAYLYATEIQAIDHYWFDVHGLVLAPEYKNVDVAQLFGGKYIHNTWWTDDPRQTTGINLLPITSASTYIAKHPQYVRKNLAALKDEQALWAARGKKVDPPDIWQDVFAKYLSMADPAPALAQWNRWGAVELGETRSHTLHWLLSLNELGAPDLEVRADTPLYAVFKRGDGRKTYLAFNAGKAPISVRFSDGQVLAVAPGTLARSP